MKPIRIWDLPLRLFHWLLVIAIVATFVTGKIGGNYMIWHERLAIFITGLISFRIIWGFIGSTYARFCNFIPTPLSIMSYLKGKWHGVGHNPLGALSVFALLGIVSFQLITGLFTFNDTTLTAGPLHPFLDKIIASLGLSISANELADKLTSWHRIGVNFLIFFVALHIFSIIFYALVKKDKLLPPMITGNKKVPEDSTARSATGGGFIAFIIAIIIAGLVAWGASGIWIAPPPVIIDIPAW